jgi:hypothetical protein
LSLNPLEQLQASRRPQQSDNPGVNGRPEYDRPLAAVSKWSRL